MSVLMGRKASITDQDLMRRLSDVFRDVGYEGATLSALSVATGLQKASLYHRFPKGKEQIASEVLQETKSWLENNILLPLQGEGSPRVRIQSMTQRLDEFYSGGRQACLLNALSTTHIAEGPFSGTIKQIFEAFISTLSDVLCAAGLDKKLARFRAERTIIMLQGTLVYARGTGSTRAFRDFLKALPDELLEGIRR